MFVKKKLLQIKRKKEDNILVDVQNLSIKYQNNNK